MYIYIIVNVAVGFSVKVFFFFLLPKVRIFQDFKDYSTSRLDRLMVYFSDQISEPEYPGVPSCCAQ